MIDRRVLPLTPTPANATFWTPREVFVSVNGQDFSGGDGLVDRPMTYRYYPLPTLTEVIPNGGPANPNLDREIGSTIFVRGSGFNVLDDALALARGGDDAGEASCDATHGPPGSHRRVWCRYGITPTAISLPSVRHNDTVVECPLPREHGAGHVLVQISLNGVDWSGSHGDSDSDGGDYGDGADGASDAASEAGGDFNGPDIKKTARRRSRVWRCS